MPIDEFDSPADTTLDAASAPPRIARCGAKLADEPIKPDPWADAEAGVAARADTMDEMRRKRAFIRASIIRRKDTTRGEPEVTDAKRKERKK